MKNIPSINLELTGKNIIRMRKRCGVSVKDLQHYFGFATPQAIYKWQHGTSLPTVDNLLVLARIFQTTIEEILVLNESQGAFVFGTSCR